LEAGAQPVRGGERVGVDFAFPVLMILVKWNNSVVYKMHLNIKKFSGIWINFDLTSSVAIIDD